MTCWPVLKSYIHDFCQDTRGTVMVETVMTLPILFWGLAATFEFFEVHRYKSAREKATYTIADLISRENDVVTDVYVDNALTLFNEIADDSGVNQLRITVIRYIEDDDEFEVSWSKVRGSGGMSVLRDVDVRSDHDVLPMLDDGEEVILIESESNYSTIFDVGFSDDLKIKTRTFTGIRFAPQVCFDECS